MDCGRLFCFGFDGLEPPDSILFALDRQHVGAVILFARNCQNGSQIRRLTRKLREAGGEALWILVDQEGGRVRRILDPDIGPPSPSELATRSPSEVEEAYRECGSALLDLGIDFNLAPVADVGVRADSAVLAGRTLGDDPEEVAARVEAAVRGLSAAAVKSCAKHFPGLGDAASDPHLAAARSDTTSQAFRDIHFPPFRRAACAGATAIMTTHLLAPALDPHTIATYSHVIADDLMEERAGFRRIVLTDDLEMRGVPDPPPQAAWYAFEAGHHLLLLCHDPERQREALDLFNHRVSGDSVAHRRLHRALDRQAPYRTPFAGGRV
jgi:beta-N-acetylhexosaminidase